MKKPIKMLLCLVSLVFLGPTCCYGSDSDGYSSPYSIEFSVPRDDLMAIDQIPPRDDWKLEAKEPYSDWYSGRTLKECGAWGPHPRQYPGVSNFDSRPITWKRQRVLAVAAKHIGLPYQHHHIPAWDPPASWPWKQVAYGRNSKGLDCSDFTSWIYNYGLGFKLDTGIKEQANTVDIAGPGGDGTVHVRTLSNDNGYDDLVRKLKTGDLLYIKNDQGDVGHVIMWVGVHGKSPDSTPLVIDCTGPEHKDCNGNPIPIGVQIRPFLPNEWYYKSFSHAHRILGDES